ncbi:agmatinase [Desulfovibrio ferrophilus]|uniref:SpeB protein n=1 Tax=Desulfovibrio ferrophilus TaxID=241368 RepID=A0A2Z6B1D3_9BACT|nr:agmatinase [Desulfovibrio ferrophilus]BBD09206.1 SpeB protein [Desulfovibrio ferrophilus]
MNDDRLIFMEDEIGNMPATESLFHVIPVPWEASVSYGGGTAQGPEEILKASDQLEVWDGQSIPAEKGIHTLAALDCSGDPEEVLTRIEQATATSLKAGAVPVLLGGEHTVTLGALRAVAATGKKVGVIQFDAHADLRDTYEGSPYSHACVMHRALDIELPLFQIGIRSLSPAEVKLRQELTIPGIDGPDLPLSPPKSPLLPEDFPEAVYVTFDVDGLDPSLMPATGTPEPGGLFWHQAMWLLDAIATERTIIGFDVVELAPIPDMHAPQFICARLAYNLMGMIARQSDSQ